MLAATVLYLIKTGQTRSKFVGKERISLSNSIGKRKKISNLPANYIVFDSARACEDFESCCWSHCLKRTLLLPPASETKYSKRMEDGILNCNIDVELLVFDNNKIKIVRSSFRKEMLY